MRLWFACTAVVCLLASPGYSSDADALETLNALSSVTGDNRLAHCMVPSSSPYADGIARAEAANTIHSSPPWLWVDNISRDQIVGAFFGLGVAFDLVDDPSVRSLAADVATRLIGYISRHQWAPDDDLSSTFQLRPEELQMLLQVARHLNPRTRSAARSSCSPSIRRSTSTRSATARIKFSLDYMSLYHLARLQPNGDNKSAYADLRSGARSHQNAFFNMIDRALNGPDAARAARPVAPAPAPRFLRRSLVEGPGLRRRGLLPDSRGAARPRDLPLGSESVSVEGRRLGADRKCGHR